jgi:prophage DNA circulation protein
MSTILKTIMDWYNNNVAFANTSGLVTMVSALAAMWLANKRKKQNQAITIDVTSATGDVKMLADKVSTLETGVDSLSKNLVNLNDIILLFATGTNIADGTKKEIINLYANMKNNVANLKKDVKEIITTTSEEAKTLVIESEIAAKEVIKEAESIMDRYRKELEV